MKTTIKRRIESFCEDEKRSENKMCSDIERMEIVSPI